jgi:transmembrane sensor
MHADHDIAQIAIHWATRLRDHELSVEETAAFHAWLENPRHAEEFCLAEDRLIDSMYGLPSATQERLVALSQTGDAPAAQPSEVPVIRMSEAPALQAVEPPAPRQRRRTWYALAASVALVAVLGASFTAWQQGLVPRTYATEIGETRSISLPDGSAVHLNAQTVIRWPGLSRDRRAELVTGEALFEVVHDEAHPFYVRVDEALIRVLGTRFDVNRRPKTVVLTVLEGAVNVRGRDGAGTWQRVVRANERVSFSNEQLLQDVLSTDAPKAIDWREGTIDLSYEPVTNVIDQLSRYTAKPIVIADDRIRSAGGLLGVIQLNDVRGALMALEIDSPIVVRETEREFILEYRTPPELPEAR